MYTLVAHRFTPRAADKRVACCAVGFHSDRQQSGLLRVQLLTSPFSCNTHNFSMSRCSGWSTSGRSALPAPASRCSAGQRSGNAPRFMFDLRRQEGGLVPAELRRRRLAHCSGPGSLKLLPCRGNPFVDLFVTMLQISEGANQELQHRPLSIPVEGARARMG